MLLDRVVDRLGGLSGRPSGRPVWDPPKTLQMGPGPARARNRPILNRVCIEKYTDFDGRRIREFCLSRTRPDLVLFRALGGIDFRVGFLRVFVSRIRFVSSRTLRSRCPKPTSGGRSTASRGDLQDLGMSRSGVFAIRVGYEGEGGTALREQSLTERQPDNG